MIIIYSLNSLVNGTQSTLFGMEHKFYLYQNSNFMFIKKSINLYRKSNFIFIKNQNLSLSKINFIFIKILCDFCH